MRMCVACRCRFAKASLHRYVLSGDRSGNGLEEDIKGRKPGRGWYLCGDPQCHERFLKMKFRLKPHTGSRTHG